MKSKINSLTSLIWIFFLLLLVNSCQVNNEEANEFDVTHLTILEGNSLSSGTDRRIEGDGIQINLKTEKDSVNQSQWNAIVSLLATEERSQVKAVISVRSNAHCSATLSGEDERQQAPRGESYAFEWDVILEKDSPQVYELKLQDCYSTDYGKVAELMVEVLTGNGIIVWDQVAIFVFGDDYQILPYGTPYPTPTVNPDLPPTPSNFDADITAIYPSSTPMKTPESAKETIIFQLTGTSYPTQTPKTPTSIFPTSTPVAYP